MRGFFTRIGVGCLSLIVGVVLVTPLLASRGEDRWIEAPEESARLAGEGVRRWVDTEMSRDDFTTGSELFDGEWLFGTYVMAGIGYTQSGIRFESLAGEHARLGDACIDLATDPDVRAFHTQRVGEDPIASLGSAREDHAAYLGYLGVLLGLQRQLEPGTRFAGLHDRIAAQLEAKLEQSPIGLLETYPGEVYPVDNLSVFATLALHERTTGTPHPVLARVTERLERDYFEDGILIQAVDPTGRVVDGPRGSGTALGAYFTSFVDRDLSARLYAAIEDHLQRSFLGFGWVREYPPGQSGWGDIDSGPVVFGAGVSASGFSLSGALLHGDHDHFRRTHALVHLWGAPAERDGVLEYATGGPLGNALLFAMTTADPAVSFGPPQEHVVEIERNP